MISAALLHAPILAALPAGCREAQVKKEKARFVISFKCCVSCDDNKGKPRKYVYVRHATTSANGWPKLCHDAVMRKHGACFDVDCPLAGKTVTEGKLEKQVNSLKADLKRKSFELDSSKVSTHPNPIPHPGFGKATPTQTLTLILIQGSEKQTASGQSRAKKTATERGKRRATKIEPSNRSGRVAPREIRYVLRGDEFWMRVGDRAFPRPGPFTLHEPGLDTHQCFFVIKNICLTG